MPLTTRTQVPDEMMLNDCQEDSSEDTTSKANAIRCLEDMALSVLSQLGTIMGSMDVIDHSDNEADEDERVPPRKLDRRIAIELASRNVHHDGHVKRVHFPPTNGKTRSFASLMRTMELCHRGLLDDTPLTKREIYYHDVPLFVRQSTVDTLVDDLAATFGLHRADLNVTAARKGLVCGSMTTFHLKTSGVTTLNPNEATLIPTSAEIERIEVSEEIGWVLIVEKEAVFQTLCADGFATCTLFACPGLIITGKGYPDLATRQLVCRLGKLLPEEVPFYALVDGDPHGIDILRVYKFGSKSMRHENDELACPRVEWLGLKISELRRLGLSMDSLLPMSHPDLRKCHRLLTERLSPIPLLWKRELSIQFHALRKAEIEIISSCPFDSIECPYAMPGSTSSRKHFSHRLSISGSTLRRAAGKDEFEYWERLRGSPRIIPYLVSKLIVDQG